MTVLITGATGTIGKKLVKKLAQNGVKVHYLTTSRNKIEESENVKGFFWNPDAGVIDYNCFSSVTTIIHLAGASIAKRWTNSYKEKIITSRTLTANLLFKALQNLEKHSVKHFISASAIGIYQHSFTKLHIEEHTEIDNTFLGNVVVQWEASATAFHSLGIKVSILRTGLVLDTDGGAFPPLMKSVKYFVGMPFASGKQWQSWIHIDDLVAMYNFIVQTEKEGVFNAVAPNPVSNKKLTQTTAIVMDRPCWKLTVPRFVLQLGLGQMSYLLTASQRVSSRKIEKSGFTFKYTHIHCAVSDLLKKTQPTTQSIFK